MNKQHLYGLINPFERIAGLEALLWGLAGMVVSTALSFYSGWHYHGLLHFGPAPTGVVVLCGEHLAVWLIPAVMFYLGDCCFPVHAYGWSMCWERSFSHNCR